MQTGKLLKLINSTSPYLKDKQYFWPNRVLPIEEMTRSMLHVIEATSLNLFSSCNWSIHNSIFKVIESQKSQNEFLHIMTRHILHSICCEATEAGYAAIMVDNTTAICHKEQKS
jgi:hypothetical protein